MLSARKALRWSVGLTRRPLTRTDDPRENTNPFGTHTWRIKFCSVKLSHPVGLHGCSRESGRTWEHLDVWKDTRPLWAERRTTRGHPTMGSWSRFKTPLSSCPSHLSSFTHRRFYFVFVLMFLRLSLRSTYKSVSFSKGDTHWFFVTLDTTTTKRLGFIKSLTNMST